MRRLLILLNTIFIFYIPNLLFGNKLLDSSSKETIEKDTSLYVFSFTLTENENRIVLNLKSNLEQGTLNVWLCGGGYEVIGNYTDEGTFQYENLIFGPLNNKEPIVVNIMTNHAVGDWHINIKEISRSSSLLLMIVSGSLVIILTLVIIISWKNISSVSWKWLLLGAGVWMFGVLLKFVCAFFFNEPVLNAIKTGFGQYGYLSIGSLYIGLLTGMFEIGITLIFALLIKTMYENAKRGVSIGLGAGAIEALLIGFSSIGSFVMVLTHGPNSDAIMAVMARTSLSTPILWLVSPVERIIAILCHTSSRVLVLFGVFKKRYIYFWAGFLLLTAIDAIVGYFHLADLVYKISTWWIELLLLPFAIISIPIIKYCIKHWHQSRIKND